MFASMCLRSYTVFGRILHRRDLRRSETPTSASCAETRASGVMISNGVLVLACVLSHSRSRRKHGGGGGGSGGGGGGGGGK